MPEDKNHNKRTDGASGTGWLMKIQQDETQRMYRESKAVASITKKTDKRGRKKNSKAIARVIFAKPSSNRLAGETQSTKETGVTHRQRRKIDKATNNNRIGKAREYTRTTEKGESSM